MSIRRRPYHVTLLLTAAEQSHIESASRQSMAADIAEFIRAGAVRAASVYFAEVTPPGVEEWRPFRDGSYDASSHGGIRRMRPGIATFVGRPLRPTNSSTGYTTVGLHMTTGAVRMYTHRVVAEAFLGPCPAGHVVNHRDGDKKNNAVANLEYVTTRANARHAVDNLTRHRGPTKPVAPRKGPQVGDDHWSRRTPGKVARGERMGTAKLTAAIVIDIRSRAAAGERQNALARQYNISVAQVSRIVRRLRWAHVGGE